MAKYDVTAPDGQTFEVNAPDGASEQAVLAYAKAQFAQMSKDKVSQIPNNVVPPQAATNPLPGEQTVGTIEAALAAGTGMIGGIAGQVAGVGRTISQWPLSGISGAQAMREGQDTARNVADAMTYRPRTDTGQNILETVGNVMDATKLAGMPPAGAITAAGRLQTQLPIPRSTVVEQPAMAGVGAAMTAADRLRAERAQALPVPLELTKAMVTRDFEQQRFERETGKDSKLGAPIRERHADLNANILLNFDAILDQTGAEAGGLRAAGQIVNDAVVKKAKAAKDRIDAAYKEARASGAMSEEVPYGNIRSYIEAQTPTVREKLAPIIKAVDEQLSKNDPDGKGTLSINALEDVRKLINQNIEPGTPGYAHGIELKKLIDASTEGAGGDVYKRARALRTRYAREFEEVGVIDKLMRTKPGSSDRAVAYEDVFKHSILSGSLDDVRAVRRTLQTAGSEGAQAWRELQGQTVQYMKDEITKNVATDIRGNKVVSAARLDRMVNELDKDGKLDFIFGKTGAQQVRDISEAARDVLTFPPGSVNTSGTASVLLDALGAAAFGRLPTAAAQTISAIKKSYGSRALQKRVAESIAPNQGLIGRDPLRR